MKSYRMDCCGFPKRRLATPWFGLDVVTPGCTAPGTWPSKCRRAQRQSRQWRRLVGSSRPPSRAISTFRRRPWTLSRDLHRHEPLASSQAAATDSTRHTLSLYHNCDSTTIRRYHDAFDYDGSDWNYDLRSIRLRYMLRYDYDTTTTKNWHAHLLLASNRDEWKQARAIRRSRIVVVS